MKNGKLSGKRGFGKLAGKLRRLFNLKKRARQTVCAFLILTMLFGAFVFDIEMFKAWAQSGCGGPDAIFQNCALGGGQVETDLTNQAIDDVIAAYKLPPLSRSFIMQSMRNEVRAMLFSRLLDLINKPDKTSEEIQALATFGDRIRTLRVNSATAARAEYDRWTQNACGGYQPPAPYTYNSPGCTPYTIILNGAPTSPTFEEFQQYGSAIAYQGLFTPEAQGISEKTSQNLLLVGSLAAVGAGATIGTSIGQNITVATFRTLLPTAARTFSSTWTSNIVARGLVTWTRVPLPAGASSGTMGGVLAGGPVAVIMTAIQILVTQTINVVNQAQVPDKLNQAIIDNQNSVINLNQMVTTDMGNGEIWGVFLLETLPDFPAPIAPPADPNDRQFIIQHQTLGTYESASFPADLGWGDSYTTPLRLSGSLFAYSADGSEPERQSVILRFKNWQDGDMLAFRVGGQFFVMTAGDVNTGRLMSYLFLKSNGARVKVEIKQTNMQLYENETVKLRCGLTITPDPGTDKVIGRIAAAGEPSSNLTATINGGATATVNGITVRDLRINSDYEVIGNVVATNVAPATEALFTLNVQNSIGQQRSARVNILKTAVLDTLPWDGLEEGTVGTPFTINVGDIVEVGCSSFSFSVDGDIPPGTTLGLFNSVYALRGTPTSGGIFQFVITKTYSSGESIAKPYYIKINTDIARMDDSAVSWWRAEIGVEDYFKRANGTVVGNVSYQSGKVNRGFNFDGGNNYIKLPETTFSPGNSFTFETWFKTDRKGVILGRQQAADPYGNPAGASPLIYVDHNGKLRVQMFRDQFNRFITSNERVDNNQFHHVAVTYDWTTETRRVYLDGAEVGSLVGGQMATSSKYQFGVGYVSDGTTNGWLNFKGVIDEPTLYSRPLNAAEIGNIFKAGTIGKLYLKIRPYAPSTRNGNDGGIFIEAQGSAPPLTYRLDMTDIPVVVAIQETSNFMSLFPRIYRLTVTDSLGFDYSTLVNVPNAPPDVRVSAGELTPPRCFGEQGGSMRVLIDGYNAVLIGGTQFSIFNGANFQNSNFFTNLSGGTYTPAILDSSSNTITYGQSVTLAQPAPFAFSPSAFPNARVGTPYSQTFTLTGNNAPYTFYAEGNDINNNYDLPAGLSATVTPDTITVSGTPTASGTFPIRIIFYDRNGCQGSRTMNLNIVSAANVAIAGRVTNGGQGLPNATVTLSGGANQTATTDASGNYSFNSVPANQDYTVSTMLTGYTFAQSSLTFNAVNANIGDADFPTAFTHYEGDIAPRSTGDGSVDVRDYVALSRIIANQESRPAAGGEWQRASVAPRSTLGSTTLQGADLTQILNYIVRNNPLTLVGGPSNPAVPVSGGKLFLSENPAESLLKTESSAAAAPATVSADTVAPTGNTASVPIRMSSDGTVTAAQFTITYDNTKLFLNSITNGGDANNLFITNTGTLGKINVVAIRNGGGTFPANTALLRLNFSVNAGATGSALIDFTDTPTQRLATDAAANAVTLNSIAGRVDITPPTAAQVRVSGRVLSATGGAVGGARVALTMPNGAIRTARTNSFGYYRFEEVPVGETYVIAVEHKTYVFNPQIINLTDEFENLDFTATNSP